MKYMLLIFSNPENWAALSEAETKEVMDEYWQFTQTITSSGEFVSGEPLQGPDTATVVRVSDGPQVDQRRAVHREQGAPRRLLRRRLWLAGPGAGARGAHPGRALGRDRGTPGRRLPVARLSRRRPEQQGPRRVVQPVVPEDVFRAESGRVLGALMRRFGDLDLAEDAYQDACLSALETWPRDGVPTNPGRG